MNIAPEVGDFTAWIVGMPGPDVDYALCIQRDGGKALLRHQVWQEPGDWHETWCEVKSPSNPYGCWKTERLGQIKQGLRDEAKRLFPREERPAP